MAEFPPWAFCNPKTDHDWGLFDSSKTCDGSARINHVVSNSCFTDRSCSAKRCEERCESEAYCRFFYWYHKGEEFVCDTFMDCDIVEAEQAGGELWSWSDIHKI